MSNKTWQEINAQPMPQPTTNNLQGWEGVKLRVNVKKI